MRSYARKFWPFGTSAIVLTVIGLKRDRSRRENQGRPGKRVFFGHLFSGLSVRNGKVPIEGFFGADFYFLGCDMNCVTTRR